MNWLTRPVPRRVVKNVLGILGILAVVLFAAEVPPFDRESYIRSALAWLYDGSLALIGGLFGLVRAGLHLATALARSYWWMLALWGMRLFYVQAREIAGLLRQILEELKAKKVR